MRSDGSRELQHLIQIEGLLSHVLADLRHVAHQVGVNVQAVAALQQSLQQLTAPAAAPSDPGAAEDDDGEDAVVVVLENH